MSFICCTVGTGQKATRPKNNPTGKRGTYGPPSLCSGRPVLCSLTRPYGTSSRLYYQESRPQTPGYPLPVSSSLNIPEENEEDNDEVKLID
ncbi:hypothetical protein PGT21_017011 [Puccinia graminis f. sp. tritici]|uniref:Uncharacterized protein n=1 Tax=Puccinia graminis f. sp. tritici TaxID=56615 RepID=A0A5B0NKQ8_PUCGR|nr:hypothetical protein PGT21_017011 [Puccinia graminis f. sp. tritici]KAA1089817.1 hypothetical protein PGTUg99_018320 [Puccinia graminis f. sp. tritici]